MPSFFEWRYVVETSKDGGENWTYNDSPFDDQEQAIAHAKTLPKPVRVRQFCTTIYTKEGRDIQPRETNHPDSGIVPTVPWYCPSHPTITAQALETSQPRCKTCHQVMFQGDGTEEIQDL